MKHLKDKVAVITGGNSGIGKATARLFAEEGAQVVITGRRAEIVDQALAEIGHGSIGVVGDVADLQHHRTLAETVKSRFGGLDIYMANAAMISLTPSANVTPEEYDQHFAINIRGVFFGVQIIEPLIRNGGNIIVTSSLGSHEGVARSLRLCRFESGCSSICKELGDRAQTAKDTCQCPQPGTGRHRDTR